MRITMVCPFDPNPPAGANGTDRVGGVERVFAEVSQKLAQRGHKVTLLCSTSGPSGSRHENGIRVVRRHRNGTFLKAPLVRLSKSIGSTAQVVHVAATYPFTTPGVLRRAHELGIPSVLDFHFEPAPGTTLGRLAAATYRQIGPRQYPLASVALVRSVAYGSSAPSLKGVPSDAWRVIPNGIDPAHFNADGPSRDGNYILFVGRLVPYKGLSVLLDAMALLPAGIGLLIAGQGPLGDALKAQASRLGLDVTFLGRVPDADLPALYRGARLTVLPSVTAQECFGISLLESLACGTPVVASALPGVAEVAALGGLTAEPANAKAFAQQVQRGLVAGALPRGKALAAAVHAAYSWDAVTDRLESVYRGLLGQRHRAPMGKAA